MLDQASKIIKEIEQALGIKLYLVGGAVRDLFLQKQPKDWDFTTPSTPDEVETAIHNIGKRVYGLGKKFGTLGFKWDIDGVSTLIEVTTFRNEIYQPKNRKPEVNFTTHIDSDLARRDFTINAMVLTSSGKLIDPFGGQQDLSDNIIRAVGHPTQRFREDPLRLLRAIRFAGKLQFGIEEKTYSKIPKLKFELLSISKERWVMELDTILAQESVFYGLNLLMDSELLGVIIPELALQKDYNQNNPHHDFHLWEHTCRVVQSVPASQLDLRWAALLHDIAKPFTRTENPKGHSNYIGHNMLGADMGLKICNHLKFSKSRTNFIVETILHHLEEDSTLKHYDDLGKKQSE